MRKTPARADAGRDDVAYVAGWLLLEGKRAAIRLHEPGVLALADVAPQDRRAQHRDHCDVGTPAGINPRLDEEQAACDK